MASSLRQVLILSRNLKTSRDFYERGLGFQVSKATEAFVEFDTQSNIPLVVQWIENNEAACSSGYSPFLNINVHDMDTIIVSALKYGGILDGPIKYPTFGKIASMRSPDGNMIGLFEQAEK